MIFNLEVLKVKPKLVNLVNQQVEAMKWMRKKISMFRTKKMKTVIIILTSPYPSREDTTFSSMYKLCFK